MSLCWFEGRRMQALCELLDRGDGCSVCMREPVDKLCQQQTLLC
jgi:hypothetical protein